MQQIALRKTFLFRGGNVGWHKDRDFIEKLEMFSDFCALCSWGVIADTRWSWTTQHSSAVADVQLFLDVAVAPACLGNQEPANRQDGDSATRAAEKHALTRNRGNAACVRAQPLMSGFRARSPHADERNPNPKP